MSRLHVQGSSPSRASTLFKAHGISDPQFPSAQNTAHDSIITFPTGLIGNQVKSQTGIGNCNECQYDVHD